MIQALDSGDINQAVLPCEDSAGGTVSEVYDCLANFDNIQIVKEFAYEIDHCLVALPGVKLVDIKSVYCYPQVNARNADFNGKIILISHSWLWVNSNLFQSIAY